MIPSLAAREAIGFCGKCHTWLGRKESTKPSQPEVVVSQTDIQTALGVLTLLQSATLPPETNTLEKVASLIDWVCQTTAIHPPALATRLGLKRHLLYRMLAQEDLLNIPTLLAVVTGTRLEVRDFIQKLLVDLVQSDPLKQFISSFSDQQRPAPTRLRPSQHVTSELLPVPLSLVVGHRPVSAAVDTLYDAARGLALNPGNADANDAVEGPADVKFQSKREAVPTPKRLPQFAEIPVYL